MAEFTYKAIDMDGNDVEGKIEGDSVESISDYLYATKQIFVLSATKKEQSLYRKLKEMNLGKVSNKELALFTRKIARMTEAGVPLTTTFEILISSETNAILKKIEEEAYSDILAGSSLSNAFSKHKKYFSPFMLTLTKVGEESSQLDTMYTKLSEILESQARVRSGITKALIYPVILLFVAMGVGAVLFFFLLPLMVDMLNDFGVPIPAITTAMLNFADFLKQNAILIVTSVGLFILGIAIFSKTERAKRFYGKSIFKIPLIKDIYSNILIGRTCVMLSTMLRGGVNIITCFQITKGGIKNLVVLDALDDIVNGLSSGSSLTAATKKHEIFPKLFISMVEIGEETGALSNTLNDVGKYYEEQADETLKTFTAAMEPISILIVTFMVGTLALATFVPILALYQYLGTI